MYPEGTYEYGQIGIGTCLGGPVDLTFLDDGHTLAVANSNPFGDFVGGSTLLLDLDRLDPATGRNLVSGLARGAVDLPSYTGDMEYLPETGTLAVVNRLSEGERTREIDDAVYFIDVADPDAPRVDTALGPDAGAIDVGWDPNAIVRDPSSGLLFVVDRTGHAVSLVDVSAPPAEIVAPGGPARTIPGPFEDLDGSGSTAEVVTLDTEEALQIDPHTWNLSWNTGSVSTWIPVPGGVQRYGGNGEGLWEAAPNGLDIDTSTTDLIAEVEDPSFIWAYDPYGDAVARLLFMDNGYVRDAQSLNYVTWSVGDSLILGPDEAAGEAVIGGPAAVVSQGLWHLFYDAGNGDDQSIYLATAVDGTSFDRLGPVLVAPEGSSYEDPAVFADSAAGVWRMWFTVVRADGWSIGEAVSDDLTTWTELPDRFYGSKGAASPNVGYWGGRFHLLYTGDPLAPGLYEAQSIDGTAWVEQGRLYSFDPRAGRRPRIAMSANAENTFSIEDETGTELGVVLTPGDVVENPYNGWFLRVAVGYWLTPDDVGPDADTGVQADSAIVDADGVTTLYLSRFDADGVGSIGRAVVDGASVDVEVDPLLAPGAGGSYTAGGVYSPVVVDAGSTWIMYFAAVSDGAPSIGRATSSDGVSWTVDTAPVLTPTESWEAGGVVPGSAWVGSDGTVHLYYTAYDGSRQRIAEATAAATGGAFTRVAGYESAWSLDAGAPGEWDDSGVAYPTVVVDGDVERLWYAGYSGSSWRIGYAERTAGGPWVGSVDADDTPRPVLQNTTGSYGADGLVRVVALAGRDDSATGYTLWLTGLDDGVTRVGRAVARDPDRAWRDDRLPTYPDELSFTVIPEQEEDAIPLDVSVDGVELVARGCSGISADEQRGFVYVTCKNVPYVYVLDARDDSGGDFIDLNYLGVEAVMPFASTTTAFAGTRASMVDPTRDWLWTLSRGPEALVAVNLGDVVDDADSEIVPGTLAAMVPLPTRGRDDGVNTQTDLGPGQMALHPDGVHLFVTNFNDNSVTVFDLSTGAPATIVGQIDQVGENPYAVAISPDGAYAVVGNYLGEVDGGLVSSTLVVIDADPTSPTFLEPLTWITNR